MGGEAFAAGRAGLRRLAARAGGAAALAAVLAGCGTASVVPSRSAVSEFFEASTQERQTVDPALLAPPIACPQVNIQPGTEAIRREAGEGGREALRWQASITETARECRETEEGTAIRVGVRGRVIEGPAGAPDAVELPVRVAVREGGEVTYSRLHAVSVARTGPSQDWAFVDEAVLVKDPESAQIAVGFDG